MGSYFRLSKTSLSSLFSYFIKFCVKPQNMSWGFEPLEVIASRCKKYRAASCCTSTCLGWLGPLDGSFTRNGFSSNLVTDKILKKTAVEEHY